MEKYPVPRPLRIGGAEFRWGERTFIMGVLNLTPDSFSGDGLGGDIRAAVERAKRLEAEGADIIDIGGQSTRPGAPPVTEEEELRRVVPVVERLAGEVSVPLSIDTVKSEVARRAIDAGASLINDVWGLRHDPRLAEAAAAAGVPLVLTANQREESIDCDIMDTVISSLRTAISQASASGVAAENIIVDPGIGFGKSREQNLEIIRRLAELKVLGRPVLLGASRKLGGSSPAGRLQVNAAAVAFGIAKGADIVRVHEVREMALVAKRSDSIFRRSNG